MAQSNILTSVVFWIYPFLQSARVGGWHFGSRTRLEFLDRQGSKMCRGSAQGGPGRVNSVLPSESQRRRRRPQPLQQITAPGIRRVLRGGASSAVARWICIGPTIRRGRGLRDNQDKLSRTNRVLRAGG